MLSRTRWARASSMPTTGLNKTSRSRNSRTAKLTRCHSRPCQFNPSVLAIASISRSLAFGGTTSGDLADEDERDHQRINRDSFGEAEADEQWHQDGADDLGVSTDRLHGFADAVA